MAKKKLTDEEVELEIARLSSDPDVRLARMEQRMRYRRRQYLYQLRDLKKKGEALAKSGITEETILNFEKAFERELRKEEDDD